MEKRSVDLPLEENLASLEERLGYRFKNRQLLIEAITHSSAGEQGVIVNERLEFLGDRVLGLLAAEALIVRFPESPEGDLAPRLNALVRKERCAAVATAIGLAPFIHVSQSEAKAGRALKPAILGDACEAVIAAIFLDGGLGAARQFFERAWAQAMDEVDVLPQDAKSALQEWTQDRGLGLPNYALIERTGPHHQPVFSVRASVTGEGDAEGKGPSKRAAEQNAAAAFLLRLGAWTPEQAERARTASQ